MANNSWGKIEAKIKLRSQEQAKPRKGQCVVSQLKVKEKLRQTKAKEKSR